MRLLPLLLLCMLPPAAIAGDEPSSSTSPAPSSFTGTWVQDTDASDSLDPILKAQGVSWVKRSLASGVSITLTIQDAGDRVQILTRSSAGTSSDAELWLDGQTRSKDTKRGPSQSSSRRLPDGSIVTTARLPEAKQTVTVRRWVTDGGSVLRQTITVVADGHAPASATLVFRRARGTPTP